MVLRLKVRIERIDKSLFTDTVGIANSGFVGVEPEILIPTYIAKELKLDEIKEPEAHSFPYYTKYLAERIALDKRNQYFISTHNPYLLLTLIEKTPTNDLAVYITYYENYQTKVKMLSTNELDKILRREIDVFFSIKELVEA